MATRTVTIASSVGLHARPAALFVEAASATGLDVEIGRPGEELVDATSILGVMALGAKHGEDCEHDPNSVIQRYINLYKTGINKPWVFATSGGFKYDIARNTMRDAGLPVFDQCDRACRALANLIRAWVGKFGFLE